MATTHKLTLAPYLQRWDHTARTLKIRLLVVPTNNPLKPLVPVPVGVSAFADANLTFSVHISDSVDVLPQRTLVDQVVVLPDLAAAAATLSSPDARAIFTAIQDALDIPDSPAADTFAPQSRDATKQLRKYLPKSYRQSFAFVKPRTSLAVIDDSYRCLMKCPPAPVKPPPPMVIGWGEAIAFALRQPRLAQALGLIYDLSVPLDAAPRLERGGWLWVELEDASDYAAQTSTLGFLRTFATRVPALPADAGRPVFSPVLFPVSDTAKVAASLGNFDKVFVEALRFDDGFAKIVHARQQFSTDPLDESGDGAPLVRDEGVQLAWDDEDILEGQNRALGAPPDGEDPILAPRGVLGYRVDVRADGGVWNSLSLVNAPLNIGVDLGVAVEERWSEVMPNEHSDQIWLPAWFLRWRGGSLVTDTLDEQRLMEVPATRPALLDPIGADTVELRYGRRYEFRVRLADTTGGGPAVAGEPVTLGEAPVAAITMKRFRAPGAVRIDLPVLEPDGSALSLRVERPRLGYPEAVFAAGASARAALLARIAANDSGLPADAVAPSIPDPDTVYLEIRVLVRALTFDPAADADGFVEWYTTTRRFPDDPTLPLDLTLDWHDAADYAEINVVPQLGAEGTIGGVLPMVTARDLRLELLPLGRNDLAYFGNQRARRGRVELVDFHVVASAAAEVDVLRPLPDADTLRSVFLRPDPVGARAPVRTVVAQNEPSPALLGRLASALDLVADGAMLLGPVGDRMAFGCAGLTYHAAPDASSIELTDPAELAGQWINAVQVVIDRDWTWRGAGSPTLVVNRTVSLPDAMGAVSESVDVGTIELMSSTNMQATKRPNRSFTRMVFLDAIPPRMGPDGLPYEMAVTYRVRLQLEGGEEVVKSVETRLPIVTPPKQVPKVVAAGIALTPYGRGDLEYASTDSRKKSLWLEFSEPLADVRDAWFVKALTSTPDPMLLPGMEPMADPVVVEGVQLDAELIRVITPGQVQDLAGLSAMQRLEPSASSDRHFLLPLPPNTDPGSPELFSFYTYEIRAGHDRGPVSDPLWSTAQGRFGESLVLDGVQHPAPELSCSVIAQPDGGIHVRAPFASPYLGLRRVLPNPPNTEIWVVLYARVMQADASTRRNIQIDLRQLQLPPKPPMKTTPQFVEGEIKWSGTEVESALHTAGLPEGTPISALAVELLPEPNASFDDPLGGDLGQVRILRTSPLAPVDRDCCTS